MLVEIRIYPVIAKIFVAISWRLPCVLSVRNFHELLLMLIVMFFFAKSLLFIFSSTQTQSAERDRWINLSLEASNEVSQKKCSFFFKCGVVVCVGGITCGISRCSWCYVRLCREWEDNIKTLGVLFTLNMNCNFNVVRGCSKLGLQPAIAHLAAAVVFCLFMSLLNGMCDQRSANRRSLR